MIRPTFLLITLMILIAPSSLMAQSLPAQSDQAPIEISAQDSLEWLQEKKQYVANGSVLVTQNDLSLTAEKLTAFYDDSNGNATNITVLEATGNVILKDATNTVKGNKINYDLQTEDVIVTGNNVSLTTPEQTITASQKLTYNANIGSATAIGNAKIKTPKETLEAQNIIATLSKKSDTQKQKLISAKATGGVKITTSDEIITGASGIYNAQKQTAEINRNVKIKRGVNTLEGDRASVNLKTNVSQIFGNKNNGKRVKGVFFPSSR